MGADFVLRPARVSPLPTVRTIRTNRK